MGGIIWIASYPKSGNTWMRAFLHNLLNDPPEPVSINALTQFTIGDTLKSWYAAAAGRATDGLSHDDWARLRPQVHQLFTTASADSVFVKTHMALGEAHGTPLISMDYTAGAIYIVRDPRDVAISAASHFGTDIDGAIAVMADPNGGTPEDARNAPQYYGSWSDHVASWVGQKSPQLHIVRYEDMLTHPRRAFGRVARFLGLPASPDRIARAIRFSSFETLQKQEARDGFVERPARAERFFRTGTAGQWRAVLTPDQIAAIERRHGAMMTKLGYRPLGATASRSGT